MLFCTLISYWSVFCFIYVTAVHMHVAVVRISSQINILLQLVKINSEFSDTSLSTLRARYAGLVQGIAISRILRCI